MTFKNINKLFIIIKDKKNKTINNILLIAIVIALSYIITCDIPQLFRYGEQLYSLLNNISLAYIASYIFFAITIYYPNKKRKVKLHRYIHNNIVAIYMLEESLIQTLLKHDKSCELDINHLKEDELKRVCRNISPTERVYADVSLTQRDSKKKFDNYFQLLNYFHEETDKRISKLMNFTEYLSDDVIMLLTHIDDNFNEHLNLSRGDIIKNPDMQIYDSNLWELYNDYRKLLYTFSDDEL